MNPFAGFTVSMVVVVPVLLTDPLVGDKLTAKDAAAACTVTVTTPEIEAALLASPAYEAVMLCAPTAKDPVLNVAVPVPPNNPVPSDVVPSRKETVPVGTPDPAFDFTTAVNVAVTPAVTAAGLTVKVVVVGAGADPVAMFSVTAADVDTALLLSPPYCAVIEYPPGVNVLMVNTALPVPSNVPLPSGVVPLKKSTVPVGMAVPGSSVT